MRLAPVTILWRHDPAQAGRKAAESARTTHGHPLALASAAWFGELLAMAVQEASKDERLLLLLLDHPGVAPEAVQAAWRGEDDGEEVEITRHGKTVARLPQAAAARRSGPGRSCADLEDSVIDAQAVAIAHAHSLPRPPTTLRVRPVTSSPSGREQTER